MEGHDNVDVGLLIRLVQNFPHIYNQKHANFKNNLLKEKTWNRIAATIKVPVDDCLRMWKNLRERYTREQRVLRNNPQDNVSKWEFYDAMEFLNPYIKRRRVRTLRTQPSVTQITTKDSLSPSSINSDVKVWDPLTVKLTSEPMSLLEEDFEDDSGEIDDSAFETELSEMSTGIKHETEQPSAISIVRYQTSEEAFGAYIATRLMEFPPEIRQIKKAKLFKELEEPEEV